MQQEELEKPAHEEDNIYRIIPTYPNFEGCITKYYKYRGGSPFMWGGVSPQVVGRNVIVKFADGTEQVLEFIDEKHAIKGKNRLISLWHQGWI